MLGKNSNLNSHTRKRKSSRSRNAEASKEAKGCGSKRTSNKGGSSAKNCK